MNSFAVHQKLTQHCQSTLLQWKKKKDLRKTEMQIGTGLFIIIIVIVIIFLSWKENSYLLPFWSQRFPVELKARSCATQRSRKMIITCETFAHAVFLATDGFGDHHHSLKPAFSSWSDPHCPSMGRYFFPAKVVPGWGLGGRDGSSESP